MSGIDSKIDIVEYREGGQNTTPRKLPGQTKYSNVTLRWGITDDMELYDWHKDATRGTIERKKRLDRATRTRRSRGGPVEFRAGLAGLIHRPPNSTPEGTDVAIETLELAHEGMERV